MKKIYIGDWNVVNDFDENMSCLVSVNTKDYISSKQNIRAIFSNGEQHIVEKKFLIDDEMNKGDTVTVKSWEELEQEFGVVDGYIATTCAFIDEMKVYCGKTATVDNEFNKCFHLKMEDGTITNYIFSPECLTPSEKTIKNRPFYILNNIVHSKNMYNGCEITETKQGVFLMPLCIDDNIHFCMNKTSLYGYSLCSVTRSDYIKINNYEVKYFGIKPNKKIINKFEYEIKNYINYYNQRILSEFINIFLTDNPNITLDLPKCEICGAYFLSSELFDIEGLKCCSSCFNDTFYECSHCGKIERITNKEKESYLCLNCQKREFLLPYHRDYPSIKFFGDDKNSKSLFMGVELEVDNGDGVQQTIKNIMPIINDTDMFMYCSRDGSLDDGIEMITQPATLEYHKSIYDKYSKIFKVCVSNGFRSHQTNTCGMHVHFNKNYFKDNEELYITRLLYLVDKFWDNVVLFSRRDQRRLDRYARKVDMDYDRYIKNSNNQNNHDYHYYAVNLSNVNTIEFRMFRGSLNIETFMATLEFVDACANLVKNKSAEEIQHMEFEQIFNGDYQYIKNYWENIKTMENKHKKKERLSLKEDY